MKIRIKKLKLLNFKGIREREILFEGDVTNISGDNGVGKTTIFDAFTWLLFGKNSVDRKDFEVKTLDKLNNVIEKIDHEVLGVLDVDGKEVELKRVLKEKWVKPRGKEEVEFQGNDTTYFFDKVPVTMKEYSQKISAICDELVFSLITNPMMFCTKEFRVKNTPDWKVRRNTLFEMVEEVTDGDVAATNKEFQDLLDRISGKKFDEFKRQLAASKKELKDELAQIPTRIDELKRSLPDPVDENAVNKMIADCEKEISQIAQEINDESAAHQAILNKRSEIQNKIYELRSQISSLEHEDNQAYQKAVNESTGEIDSLKLLTEQKQRTLAAKVRELKEISDSIISTSNEIGLLREEWKAANSQTLSFDENEFKCPACHRDFEAEDIDAKKAEMEANFNSSKIKNIERIDQKGKAQKNNLEELKAKAETLQKDVDDLTAEVDDLKAQIENSSKTTVNIDKKINPEIEVLKAKITELESELSQPQTSSNITDLTNRKSGLESRIAQLRAELNDNKQIERAKEREIELEKQSKSLGQQIADMEREEFLMDKFTKTKIEMVESQINAKFSFVKWKMYNQLINAGEEETCIATVNGVPYSDLNTAMQINAGLDIINALSKHYNTYAPIFIDHAESVNELEPTNSQMIRLVVTESKILEVKNPEKLQREVA